MSELMNEEEILQEDEQITFIVDDDQKADWCLEKIREANAEKERWTAFYMDRLKKLCDAEDARIQRMEFLLQQYFRTVPHKETKTQQSYALPSGKLVYKRQQPEWTHDDSVLLPWVMENVPNMVKVKESVDWAELKKELSVVGDAIVNADGLIVPGVTVMERPDVFKVEVK